MIDGFDYVEDGQFLDTYIELETLRLDDDIATTQAQLNLSQGADDFDGFSEWDEVDAKSDIRLGNEREEIPEDEVSVTSPIIGTAVTNPADAGSFVSPYGSTIGGDGLPIIPTGNGIGITPATPEIDPTEEDSEINPEPTEEWDTTFFWWRGVPYGAYLEAGLMLEEIISSDINGNP